MSEKIEAVGGNKAVPFDDGVFDGVKKVTVGKDIDSITYIKIEYLKDGKLEVREHGTRRGELKEFSVNGPDENIIAIGGSYDHIFNYDTTLITSLYFKTSKGTTSLRFGENSGTEFILESKSGGKLLGFHGRGGHAIDAIGAHFESNSGRSQKLDLQGGKGGNVWDDGADHDGVKKIFVGKDNDSITYIKIVYEKNGKLETREHGTNRGEVKEFSVNGPDENIIAVGGSYDHIFNYDATLITSLYFKTSKGTTSLRFGENSGTEFLLEGKNGGKLLGFHGRGGHAIDAIGAHFEISSGRSQKLELQGGKGGVAWDDGADYDGVKKVTVGKDTDSITYIKIEYEKNGKIEIREHGTNRGELKEFSVGPNENIIAVGGSYDHIFNYDATLITSLYFKTSKGTTSLRFGENSGTEFIIESTSGGKLLGFHGRGGHAIDAIGAHFEIGSGKPEKVEPQKLEPQKLELQGGKGGLAWDDGLDHDGVKKVTVGNDADSLTYIKIEYEKDGKFVTREHGTNRGELKEFSVNGPNEHIVAVGGSYDHIFSYDATLITSLFFKTSTGRTSSKFGETSGTEFLLEGENGRKLIGFHGRGGHAIDAIGAHFETDSGKSKNLELQGGNGGVAWDDGSEHDGVKKIIVGKDEDSVTYIKIDYVKDGKLETKEHGTNRGELKEFLVNDPSEYIIAIGGSYDHIFNYDSTLITSLYFKTSKGTTSLRFGEMSGTEFILESKNGGRIVGFHGRGGHAIDAIGAHFETSSGKPQKVEPEKLGPQGGKAGNPWDDGADHDGVAKIYVANGGRGIENISFHYVKNGNTKEGSLHGVKARGATLTIVIDYPNEYLVSAEGWFDDTNIIQGIQFKTNKKTSELWGYDFHGSGTQFSLQVKDKKIVGFFGFADSHVNSLGAYFIPISSSSAPPPKKVEAQGGSGGEIFDDGAFDHVRKMYVGQGDSGVAYVKFDYEKDGKRETREHGKKTLLGTEDFEVDSDDYIISMDVYVDNIFGFKSEIVTSIVFKTSKGKISQPFGMMTEKKFELKDNNGGKLVGFHGNASDVLYGLGAYFAPSTSA